MDPVIREYRRDDAADVRRCVVELQEFERAIDPRLPPGESMADGYWTHIQARCDEANGRVFVAEQDGTVVGFVAVLAAEPFTELDDPPGTYALVTDMVVLQSHRGYRIGVLAENVAARRLYVGSGFVPHLEVFVKRW